jgi:hypothetical protein
MKFLGNPQNCKPRGGRRIGGKAALTGSGEAGIPENLAPTGSLNQ